MARADFDTLMKAFVEETGICPGEKDMEYCRIVYEAEGNMLEDQKRTKPTMQNYGIYVDRLNKGLGHSTMRNRPVVCSFVELLIKLRGEGKKAPEDKGQIEMYKSEITTLRKIIKMQVENLNLCDSLKMDYAKICRLNEQQNALIAKMQEVIRELGVDPFTITIEERILDPYHHIGFDKYIDTRTGEILSEDEYDKRSRLEHDSDLDIDEQ